MAHRERPHRPVRPPFRPFFGHHSWGRIPAYAVHRISALLAGKRYEPLEVALLATYPQEAVHEATAFEIRFKFSMDMSRQTPTLEFQLLNQGRVVFLYKLVEQSLLWAMGFIGGATKGEPINRGRLSLPGESMLHRLQRL